MCRTASSKCWTTVTSTPAAARRSRRSSGWTSSGGAEPVSTSSGMGVERDDRRSRDRASASRTRCSRRYAWPRWSPSNTPTTAKIGPCSGRSAVDPGDDRPSGRNDRGRRSRRRDEHLVRAPAGRPAPDGDRRERARPARAADSAPRPARSRPPGRMNWPRADGLDLGAVERHLREARRDPCRSAGAGGAMAPGSSAAAARTASSEIASVERKRPGGGPPQRPEVGGTARRATPRSRARARTYVPAEQRDVEDRRSAGPARCRPTTQVELVDRDLPRRRARRSRRRVPWRTPGGRRP